MITLFNPTQEHTAVLTKQGAHVATIYPGQSATLEDNFGADPQVNYFVGKGILQVVPAGQRVPSFKPAPVRTPQPAISHIRSVEVPLARGGQNVVSAVNDGPDFYNGPMDGMTPASAPGAAPVQPDPNIEVIGQSLVHRGGRAQLTNMVKANVPQSPSQPNIIRMQSPGREAALDQGMTQNPLLMGMQSGQIQDSAQMIVGSPIPGQAQLVPVDDMLTQQLDVMQAQMNQIWNEHVKQRKYWQIVGSYPLMEDAKREGLIQNVMDPDILRGMAAGEKSGVLLTRIINKYYQLTGQQLVIGQGAQPQPQAPKGAAKPKGAKPKPKAAKPKTPVAPASSGIPQPNGGVVQDHLV